MNTLGLDISTKITGYSIVEHPSKELLTSGYITVGHLFEPFDKVDYIISELNAIAFSKYTVNNIVVELPMLGYGTQTTIKTIVNLQVLNALIRYALINLYDIPITIIHPSTARVRSWGKARVQGMDTKAFVMNEVQHAYPQLSFEMNRTGTDYKVGSYDEADAITIGRVN